MFTPYIQIAVNNDFGQFNAHSPYHESLRTFQALPLLDWGLLFKPYHWAFFVLPAANAYSFFFMFMAMAFLSGWALFLRQLRMPEYGRTLWEQQGGELTPDDLLRIAMAQPQHEDETARHAHRWLFCDTTPLVTLGYSGWMSGTAPATSCSQATTSASSSPRTAAATRATWQM